MNDANAAEVSLPDSKRIIRFCVETILSTLLLMLVTAGLTIYFTPKVYFSKAILEMKSDHSSTIIPFGGGQRLPPRDLTEQFARMHQPEILYPVIDRLELTKAYALPGQTISQQEAYVRLKRSLQFRQVQKTRLVELGVYDTDAQRAADIANAIAVEYKTKCQEDEKALPNRGMDQVKDELEKQRKKAEDAARVAAQIRTRYGITDSDPTKENSTVEFTKAALEEIEAQEGATRVSAIQNARVTEYQNAKAKAIRERELLEAAERAFEQQKRSMVVGMPGAIIWEKAEKADP